MVSQVYNGQGPMGDTTSPTQYTTLLNSFKDARQNTRPLTDAAVGLLLEFSARLVGIPTNLMAAFAQSCCNVSS